MMRFIASLLLCLFSLPSLAAFSLIQQQGNAGVTSTTNTRTLTSVVAGSTLVCQVGNRSSSDLPTGISDTVNGAWTLTNGVGLGASGIAAGVYFFPNSGSGSPVITVTYSASVQNIMACQEWGVGAAAVTEETSNSLSGSAGTSQSHGSITTAGAGLVLTASIQPASLTETVASGFTALTDNALRLWNQYEIRATGYTTTGTYTTVESSNTVGVIVALVEPSSSGLLLRRRRN